MTMDIATQLASLLDKGLLVAGGVMVFNAGYEILQARKQQRPSTGDEWWALVQGGFLLGAGLLNIVTSTLNALTGK
ncbi:hypothetical protein HMPREF3232_00757 [Fannyhessea vaginae]|nr:hypothetical protein HMPREF3232_00757 [Fannyhessea vaginae]